MGHSVTVQAAPVAPTRSEAKNYADAGDLQIVQRVEVKQLSADFTSREDWPFADKFIICAKHSFDRAIPKPYGYIILSKSGKCAALVKSETQKQWYVESRTDKRYSDVSQEFYFAPLDCVRFCIV